MANLDINKDFTVHPRAKAPSKYCEGYTLADVYNRYSRAKENAFEYCSNLCKRYNGWGLCISSHNAQTFTVMFNFEPWAGAIQVYERIMNDEEAREYIENYLESTCEGYGWNETDVNDFIWFDSEQILIDAGIWEEEE